MQRNYNRKFKNTLIALLSSFCEIFTKHPTKNILWVCVTSESVVRAPIHYGSIICCVDLSTWVSFVFDLLNDVKPSTAAAFPWVALSVVKMWYAGPRNYLSAWWHALWDLHFMPMTVNFPASVLPECLCSCLAKQIKLKLSFVIPSVLQYFFYIGSIPFSLLVGMLMSQQRKGEWCQESSAKSGSQGMQPPLVDELGQCPGCSLSHSKLIMRHLWDTSCETFCLSAHIQCEIGAGR